MTYTPKILEAGKSTLPNWETQDDGFLAFAFSGWNSIRPQIGHFNKKCPYATAFKIRLKETLVVNDFYSVNEFMAHN